ncbi:MAG: AAA family ATPase [Micrococcales bacterium]|nr:AAA family ATPase [Micrococcales bacterium]
MFVGRETQLARLGALLRRVQTDADAKPGRALLIRGRRRVGKSRMVEEFIERAGVPHLFYAAARRDVPDELELFAHEAAASDLPGASLFDGVVLSSWDAALRLLASALPDDGAIVVLDEIPYLMAADKGFEGTLQRAFDRELARKRVLLIGIGSDLSMMEQLDEYGRPFHQRATEMVVPPLTPAEVGTLLGLGPAEAFDAYLVTGGLPLVCDQWPRQMPLWDYLADAVSDPTSALLVSGERSLAAEFPANAQARTVLGAIGAGERTFANIGRAAGNIQPASLNRSLALLADKRVVAIDSPLSTRASKESRYRTADPYLRFWLSFLGPHLDEIERGRGARVLARIRTSWTSWRGRAIEPVLREALDRLAPPVACGPDGVGGVVGGYWTRTNDPEIDIVVADRAPVAKRIHALGSIKWLETSPFGSKDLGVLHTHRTQLPGAEPDTPLIAVSRSGCTIDGVTHITPDELLAAY